MIRTINVLPNAAPSSPVLRLLTTDCSCCGRAVYIIVIIYYCYCCVTVISMFYRDNNITHYYYDKIVTSTYNVHLLHSNVNIYIIICKFNELRGEKKITIYIQNKRQKKSTCVERNACEKKKLKKCAKKIKTDSLRRACRARALQMAAGGIFYDPNRAARLNALRARVYWQPRSSPPTPP